MKLVKLLTGFPDVTIKGSRDVTITGITSHAQAVSPGNLFIAKKGLTTHGARYIPQAVQGGAVAVLTDIYDPRLKAVTQVLSPQVGKLEGAIAAKFYGFSSQKIKMVGITGTNGKTTTSYIVKALLDQLAGPCGLIGTIAYQLGNHEIPADRTTPDVVTNHKLLHEMVMAGCRSAVMEVSSHALIQNRVAEILYDYAIFTNLSPDHLQYHGTMEDYFAAKALLFEPSQSKLGIINIDCPWGRRLAKGHHLTYALDQPADLRFEELTFHADHTSALLFGQKLKWSLLGRFNAYNVLAALAVVHAMGISSDQNCKLLEGIRPVPGRLQRVPNRGGVTVLVDFAHSEDALAKVFACLKECTTGKILTVFGCGGERDRSKRVKMAAVSERYSSLSVVTLDNPRGENPQQILDDIVAGFSSPSTYHLEPDRREAIRFALTASARGDIVLIAGKGHERDQVFAHKTLEFDDAQVAAELCEELY